MMRAAEYGAWRTSRNRLRLWPYGREPEAGFKASKCTVAQHKRPAVQLGNVADNGESKSGARYRFVQPLASFTRPGALLGLDALAVVPHGQLEPRTTILARGDDYVRVRPFAGVVDQIAHHLFQILPLAAEGEIRRAVDIDGKAAIGVDARKHARKIIDHRLHIGSIAKNIQGARRPRAAEVVINLASHHRDLPQHGIGQRTGMRGRLAREHAERRLEEMREVGDVRARATDYLRAVFDEAVEFGSGRRDLRRETAFEPPRLTLANSRECTAHTVEGLQSDSNLNEDGGDQADAKDCEGPEQDAVELRDLVLNLRYIRSDEQQEGPRGTLRRGRRNREFDAAGHEPQPLSVRSFCVTPLKIPRCLEIGHSERCGPDCTNGLAERQKAIPQRTRNLGKVCKRAFGTFRGYLPIPARIDALETRIGKASLQRQPASGSGFGGGNHLVEVGSQARIEVGFDGRAEETRQRVTADEQAEQSPDGGGCDQPGRKRIKLWRDWQLQPCPECRDNSQVRAPSESDWRRASF